MQYVVYAFLILVLVWVLAVGIASLATSAPTAAYEQLARELGGTVHRLGWFHPHVTFRHGTAHAQVGVFPGSHHEMRGPVIQLQIDWPDARLHLRLAHPPHRRERPVSFEWFFGTGNNGPFDWTTGTDNGGSAGPTGADQLDSWLTGDREFDLSYSVRASDPAATAGILSPVVRQGVERLRRLPYPSPLVIEVYRGTFQVFKAADLRRLEDLQDFVRTGLELYDQALLAASQGIEFVNDQAAQPLEHVVCSVCGEEISEDLVFCRRCKTPHHRDCWVYAGRCSTFGCGETAFQTPRAAGRFFR